MRFEGNVGAATDGGAAAIWGYPQDTITLEDTVFRANRCATGAKGGALKLHARHSASISRSAFVDNVSTDQGGGVWFDGEGPLAFENVLFAGNVAEGDRGGGATFNSGKVSLRHVTLVGNRGGQGTAAFFQSGEVTVSVHNSILANNVNVANAYEGQTGRAAVDEGGNVEWPAPPDAAHRVAAGDLVADPRLGSVVESDGTLVAPLDPRSPAVGLAVAPIASTDERGVVRPPRADTGAWQSGASCAPR